MDYKIIHLSSFLPPVVIYQFISLLEDVCVCVCMYVCVYHGEYNVIR